jgi:putative ABC transport system permease protein
LAVAMALLAELSAFEAGYHRGLSAELNRMGMQLMLVPLGCPYDAAARVLKGATLESSLPESALAMVRSDPAVALAAPLFMAAVVRERESRADVWVGLDQDGRSIKPWWHAKHGSSWFLDDASVILGSEAAEVEMRAPGDKLFSPETGLSLRVAGVLERSGTSDDNLFFVPLATAQRMFHQAGRLTAVAIRLHNPVLLGAAAERLQRIPGAQVVTLTEMMGTFLNLVGSVRTLLKAVMLIALVVSGLSVLNTLLAAVVERSGELAVLRALGASRRQVFAVIVLEALVLTGAGSALGVALASLSGSSIEALVRRWVPFPPQSSIVWLTGPIILQCLAVGLVVGMVASFYPAWQASRMQPARALLPE